MNPMNPDDLRRWVARYRANEELERELTRQNPMSPADAYASALALLRFDEAVNGSSPFDRDDPVSRREDEEVDAAWRKLRDHWLHGR